LPQLDESAQLNDEILRCPQCGKRLIGDPSACSACGFELLPHHARIHCKHCGSRILANLQKCPHCHADPRAGRIPPIVVRLGMAVACLLLLVCVGWIIFRAIATNTLPRILGLSQPTFAPTEIIEIIHVVVTPESPSATTPTMPMVIPTSRSMPTATPRGGRGAATPPSPVPASVGFYPTVQLFSPANATVYSGANAVILLEWRTVAPLGLRENEWYEAKISFAGRGNTPAERKSYTKETNWIVSADLYKEVSADVRLFKWNVTVMRVDGIDPLASPNRSPVNAPSPTGSFYWN
jgi:DNA-directed RNA polymerase subunit RPC12/RpoP